MSCDPFRGRAEVEGATNFEIVLFMETHITNSLRKNVLEVETP